MINIKTTQDIEKMRKAGAMTRETLLFIEKLIKPGITTAQLDELAHAFIVRSGGKPSFKGYGGFPASICTSINECVVHGIPDDTMLKEGDIISVDVGVCYNGFHGDSARTFPVGKISPEKQKLIDVTKQSFFEGIKNVKSGSFIGDISSQIQRFVVKHGYQPAKNLIGHGVGRHLHEEPNVPNEGFAGLGPKLHNGVTIAIEPMVNMGSGEVIFKPNYWPVITADGKPSAHYENTVLITDTGVEILT